jgi:hypothetical protein
MLLLHDCSHHAFIILYAVCFTLLHATPRYFTLLHATSRYVTLLNETSRYCTILHDTALSFTLMHSPSLSYSASLFTLLHCGSMRLHATALSFTRMHSPSLSYSASLFTLLHAPSRSFTLFHSRMLHRISTPTCNTEVMTFQRIAGMAWRAGMECRNRVPEWRAGMECRNRLPR